MTTTQSKLRALIQQVHTAQDWQDFIEGQKRERGEELEFFHDTADNNRQVEIHVFNSLSEDDQDYIEDLEVLQYI